MIIMNEVEEKVTKSLFRNKGKLSETLAKRKRYFKPINGH